jgi:hypothetical protein
MTGLRMVELGLALLALGGRCGGCQVQLGRCVYMAP